MSRPDAAAQITGMSLDELFAFVPDAAVAVDRAGRIVSANAHAETLFGYARNSLVGQHIEVLIPDRFKRSHPQLRTGYQADPRIRRMGAAAASLYGRRSDASEFPVEIMLAPLEAAGGLLTVAVISDASWRDRQLAAARLAAIVETSTDAMLAKDRDGIIMAWNAAAERLYGYSAEDIIGRPVTTIIPDERVEETAELMGSVLDGGTVLGHRTTRLNRAGGRVDVSIAMAPIHDERGRIVGASTIARDIGRELRDAAEREYAHTLVKHSQDAITAFDANGLVTTWNPAAELMFGYTAAEAVGRRISDLLVELGGTASDDVTAGFSRGGRWPTRPPGAVATGVSWSSRSCEARFATPTGRSPVG